MRGQLATRGKPNDAGCWFKVLARNTSGAVPPAQGSHRGGRQESRYPSPAREPRGAAAGPGRAAAPVPGGARRCCNLPAAPARGSPNGATPARAQATPPTKVLGRRFGNRQQQKPVRPPGRSALRTPRNPCAPGGTLRTPRLPGSEQSSNETEPTGTFPSLARSGETQTRPRWVSEENPTTPGRLRSSSPAAVRGGPARPPRKGSGPGPAVLRVQPPGLGSAHSERESSQRKRRYRSVRDTSKGTILRDQAGK